MSDGVFEATVHRGMRERDIARWGYRERGGRMEPFYVVRFNQKDLWPNYTGSDADTFQTQIAQGWLQPAKDESL